jgi:hypothetical protein
MNSMKFIDDKGNFMLSTISTEDTANATKTVATVEKDFEFEVVTDNVDAPTQSANAVEGPPKAKQGRPKQIIGPDGLTIDGKTPYGHRQCKHCEHVVKGPRTLVCPKCNTEFPKRGKNGPARSKMVTKTSVGQVRKLISPTKGIDPYLIEESTTTEFYNHDRVDQNNFKRCVTALIPREPATIRAMDYAKTIRTPPAVQFPNVTVLAKL